LEERASHEQPYDVAAPGSYGHPHGDLVSALSHSVRHQRIQSDDRTEPRGRSEDGKPDAHQTHGKPVPGERHVERLDGEERQRRVQLPDHFA